MAWGQRERQLLASRTAARSGIAIVGARLSLDSMPIPGVSSASQRRLEPPPAPESRTGVLRSEQQLLVVSIG
jgi:hypothetical protein